MTDLFHPDLVSSWECRRRSTEAFKALDPINLPDWADKHFFLPPGSSGIPGPWVTAPFQRGLMLFISSDNSKRVVIKKPARVGYTKILAASLAYFAERKRRSACLWQPSHTDVKEFVQDEVEPLFEYVPIFADALLSDPNRDKDPRNTLHRKEFTGCTLHFKGGNAAGNYRRMTLDVAMLDELDGFNANIMGSEGKAEGSPVTLSAVRISDSPYGRQIMGSTPTVKGASLIEQELMSCETVLFRYCQCVHCKEHQILEWGGKEEVHGIKWTDNDANTAHYVCVHCHEKMYWADINEIDSNGYWGNKKLRFDDTGDGCFYYIDSGTEAPWPETIGVDFSALISPFFSWTEMVKGFMEAARELMMGERMKMNTWQNTRMGQTYDLYQHAMRDPIALMNRAEDYDHDVPLGVNCIVVGCDVQVDRFELIFRGYGVQEESWALKYVKLIGNTALEPNVDSKGVRITAHADTVWDDLYKVLRTVFHHPVHGPMQAVICCIDCGYQTLAVNDFCRMDPRTFIPVKGEGLSVGHPVVKFTGKVNERGVYQTPVGSDNAMDIVHERLGIEEPGPGYMHYPRGGEFKEDFYRKLLNEQRIKKIKSGRPVWTWFCPENKDNEPADCEKYALAAIKIAQIAKGIILNQPTKVLVTGSNEPVEPAVDAFKRLAQQMNSGAQR